MRTLLIASACLVLLIANEIWWRRHERADEFSRKFVHIVAGSFVATCRFI